MDEDFPRGDFNARKLPISRRETADSSSLFEEADANGDNQTNDVHLTKRIKRKIKQGILPKQITNKDAAVGRKTLLTNIEPLTFESLTVGMLVLGCIREINRYELTISLPNGLRGTVSVTNISDAYTARLRQYVDDHATEDVDNNNDDNERALALLDIFLVGSYVVCKVKSLYKSPTMSENNSTKKISLSLNPRDVNEDLNQSILYDQMVLPAAVKSIEDHGFVMDIGFAQTTAFLKKKNALKYEMNVNRRKSLQVGQVIFCAIDMPEADFKVDVIRVIDLTAAPKQLTNAMVNNDTVNPRALIPGSLIMASISSIKFDGLYLDGLTYKAHVFKDHFEKSNGFYEPNQEVTGRVLYTHPVSKIPYVSLLPELCSLFSSNIFAGLRVWEIVESAKITHVSNARIDFDLKNGIRGAALKINVPHRKEAKIGSIHRVRIMELNYMERCAIVSLKNSDLKRKILFIENINIGDQVKCKVVSVQSNGLRVCSENLSGFIPSDHLADGQIADVEGRFPIGRKLTCRVLNLYPEKNYLMLTHKNSLVTSSKPVLASYDDAKSDLIVDGSVVAVLATGLVIRFYGHVKGFVHKSNVVNRGHSVILNKAFKRGQTVTCKVLSCDLVSSRLNLSLNIGSDAEIALPSDAQFPVGKLVSCRVSEVSDDGLDIEVFPSGVQAFLPKSHLSDHSGNCTLLLRTYKIGDVIDEVVCFATGLPPIASLKPLFVDWIKTGKPFEEFTEIKVGMRIPTVVQNYSEYGLFLTLLRNMRALVPSNILESNDLRDVYEINQTLIGIVKNLGKGHNELAISVAPRHVAIKNDYAAIFFLENFINEQSHISRFAVKSGQIGVVAMSSLTVGMIVDFIVGTASPHGIVGRTTSGVRSLVTNQHLPNADISLKQGVTLKAIVISVDFEEECAELSLCETFLNSSTNAPLNLVVVGDTYDAVCALIKEDYCLVAIKIKDGLSFGYMPSKMHPNDVFNFDKLPAVGDTIKVNVMRMTMSVPIVLRVSHSSSAEIREKRMSSIWLHSKRNKSNDRRMTKTSENTLTNHFEELPFDNKVYRSDGDPKTKRKLKNGNPLKLGVNLRNYKSLEELSAIINSYLDVPNEEKFVESDASDLELSSTLISDGPISKKRRKDRRTTSTIQMKEKQNYGPQSDSDSGIKVISSTNQVNKIKKLTSNKKQEKQNLARLNVTSGFLWDINEIAAASIKEKNESSSSEEDDDDEINTTVELKKGKRKRGLTAKLEEEELFRTEKMLVNADRQPETADDYDRLVLSSPDASLVWLKYMAFHLQSAEFDKARNVAERSLKTISFREEQEKLNVWAAFLNLENQYGSKESLNNVFQRALQFNDPLKVYNILANIYEQAGNFDAAEKLYDVMVKRFKIDLEVWSDFCTFLMKHGRLETARKSLEKSLIVLPKIKHVMMITKFVCLEFKYGEHERGRTMMESVLSSYPRRLDVWCVYVDLVTKNGDNDGARLIYERMLKSKVLQARKMRSVFKKYLNFEKQHGTPKTVAYVTQKAKEYVEKLDINELDTRDETIN